MPFASLDSERGLDKFTVSFICRAARRLIGKYGYLFDDLEEIEQELATEIVEKRPYWDPTKGTWTTFAKAVLKHKIASTVRERLGERRNKARAPQSLDVVIACDEDEAISLADIVSEEARYKHTGQVRRSASTLWELRHDNAAAMSKLSVKQRNLCRLLRHSKTITDAAKVLRISRVTASKRVRGILKRFRDERLSDFL